MPFKSSAHEKAFLLTMFLIFPLGGIGIDIYAPALPSVTQALHATISEAKLSIALYLVAQGISQFFTGMLSDFYGRKKPLVIGIIGFIIFSVLAATAQSIGWLLFFRVMQGFCVATTAVISKSCIIDIYDGEKFKRIFSWLMTVWGLGPIIAPFVGAYLTHYFGWSSCFYALALYGLLSTFLILIFTPETLKKKSRFKFSTMRANLKRILAVPYFIAGLFCVAISCAAIIFFNIFGPFLIQTKLGYSVVTFGHIALLMGFAYLLGSTLNTFLLKRMNVGTIVLSGLIVRCLASLVFAIISFYLFDLPSVVIPIFAILFTVGLHQANVVGACSKAIPEIAGLASALVGLAIIGGSGIISSAVSLISNVTIGECALIFLVFSLANLLLYVFFIHPSLKQK